MSEDINSLTIVGRLCADATLKYTNSGSAVTNLSIAVNRSRNQGDEWIEEASFFDISLFGRRGESLNQYLQKGTRIAVTGHLKQERWKDKTTNDNRSKVLIIANNIQLLGGNQNNDSQGNNGGDRSRGNNSYNNAPSGNNSYSGKPGPQNSSQGKQSYENYPSGNQGGHGNFEDDIPF